MFRFFCHYHMYSKQLGKILFTMWFDGTKLRKIKKAVKLGKVIKKILKIKYEEYDD